MVQDMVKTSKAPGRVFRSRLEDALETNRANEPENRVCVTVDENGELSSFVPGIWDQRQDGLQVAGAICEGGSGRDAGTLAQTAEQPEGTERGSGLRDHSN